MAAAIRAQNNNTHNSKKVGNIVPNNNQRNLPQIPTLRMT